MLADLYFMEYKNTKYIEFVFCKIQKAHDMI